MNNRSLVNILLLIILLGFAGFFISKKNKPADIQRLSSLKLDEINEIRIPRDNGKGILFNKSENGEWHMLKPYQIKAHSFRINTLLSLSQAPVYKTYNIEDLELSQYALDKARASIFFNNTEIKFGKANPMNNRRYLLAENRMTLLNDKIYPLVSAQASSFIDLSLIPEDFRITGIQTPDVEITFQNNQWISSHNKLNADQIQNLLQLWKSTQAFAVHRYMPRKQLGEIKIHSATSEIIFTISDIDPWLILALPEMGIEYHLDGSLKNKLFGTIEAGLDNA